MNERYPEDVLGKYQDDDGTMPANVLAVRDAVVGHRIVKVEERDVPASYGSWLDKATVITLDDGTEVRLKYTSDCCAYTEVEQFLLHPQLVDHVILGVDTTESYSQWHIFADLGDVLQLTVGWSCGNPFYYGYGFNLDVVPMP